MRKGKSAKRSRQTKRGAREATRPPTKSQPRQITIVDDVGTATPANTVLKDGEQVAFKNDGKLAADIIFKGDKGLFEPDGSDAGPEDLDPGESGETLTGKRKGKDRRVSFEVTTSKSTRLTKGSGTIKVGQTLAGKKKGKKKAKKRRV